MICLETSVCKNLYVLVVCPHASFTVINHGYRYIHLNQNPLVYISISILLGDKDNCAHQGFVSSYKKLLVASWIFIDVVGKIGNIKYRKRKNVKITMRNVECASLDFDCEQSLFWSCTYFIDVSMWSNYFFATYSSSVYRNVQDSVSS